MDMPKNHIKQKLRQGQWQVGLFAGLASGYSMEILAGAGFDWLLIDAEHSPNNPARNLRVGVISETSGNLRVRVI